MNELTYAVMHDDLALDSGHYMPGDVLTLMRLSEITRESGGPITVTLVVGFDAACEWSEEGF